MANSFFMTARAEESSPVGSQTRGRSAAAATRVPALPAPFALRCGALLIDYTAVIGIIAFSTLIAQLFGGGARMAGVTAQTVGYSVAAVALLADFLVLPTYSGQTLGKWATGLRIIERATGEAAGAGRVLLRNLIGYPLSLFLLGAGFLLAVFHSEGRALHDLLAGTVVVRSRGRARRQARPERQRRK